MLTTLDAELARTESSPESWSELSSAGGGRSSVRNVSRVASLFFGCFLFLRPNEEVVRKNALIFSGEDSRFGSSESEERLVGSVA